MSDVVRLAKIIGRETVDFPKDLIKTTRHEWQAGYEATKASGLVKALSIAAGVICGHATLAVGTIALNKTPLDVSPIIAAATLGNGALAFGAATMVTAIQPARQRRKTKERDNTPS